MAADTDEKINVIHEHLDSLRTLADIFFRCNHHEIYRSIAGPLRFLLVGSSGDKGLVEDVHPSIKFHRLRIVPDASIPADHLMLPTDVRIVRNKCRLMMCGGGKVQSLNVAGGAVSAMTFDELFDTSSPVIPLRDWLAQPFLWQNRTLGDFIRTVANKDGVAHLSSNNDLLAMKRWGHFHWHIVAHIGRYIIEPIHDQITATFPAHVRAVR